jgi:alpha-N-arabinofuranosidase
LAEIYNLSDALAVATYLNIFIRHCRTVKMANLAQMVNVIAPIVTNKDGLFLQTIYYPLQLYADYMQGIALDVYVESESFDLAPEKEVAPWHQRVADLGPFKLLDVAATYDETSKILTLAVVNRDREHAHTCTIGLTDAAAHDDIEVYELNGTDPNVVNSFAQPQAVATHAVQKRRLDLAEHMYTFPAHSLTLLRLNII